MDAPSLDGEFITYIVAVGFHVLANFPDRFQNALRHLARARFVAADNGIRRPGTLWRDAWRHNRFRNLGVAAKRADDIPALGLLGIGGTIEEPRLELMFIAAQKLVYDHSLQAFVQHEG